MRICPDIVERAAEAWKRGAEFQRANEGRGTLFEGPSADEIIMQAIGGRYSRATAKLYRDYETAVVEKLMGPAWERPDGRQGRTRLSVREREFIEKLIREGLPMQEIADRTGRSVHTVYGIRRDVA